MANLLAIALILTVLVCTVAVVKCAGLNARRLISVLSVVLWDDVRSLVGGWF